MIRLRTALPLALPLALLLAGCKDPEPPHLLYSTDAQSLENPFPDARLLTAEGLVFREGWFRPFLMQKALTSKMSAFLAVWAQGARDLDGFGNFGGTLLRTSEPVDPTSLGQVASRLVRGEGGWEVLEADVQVEHSLQALEGTDKAAPEDYPEFLVTTPTVALPEDAEGMLVLRRGIRTASGELLGRGHQFADQKGSKEQIRQAASALGIAEDEVLLTLPIRPAKVIPLMRNLARWSAAAPAPAYQVPPRGLTAENLIVGRWTAGGEEWSTLNPWLTRWSWSNPPAAVGEMVVGQFKAKDLRADGVWRAQWVADPGSAPEVDHWFVLTLPAGPRPSGGWPVVLGGHGLNARNTVQKGNPLSFCLEVAQVLAARGLGCLGLDAADHGTRGSSLDFFAVEDLRKARDNFRQTAFDMMQLVSLAGALDLDDDGQPDLAPSVGYFGNSLGAIMGGNFLGIDDRVQYGALNVAGAGLASILASHDIRDRVGLLLVTKSGILFGSAEYYSAFPLIRTLGQLFLEGADPANLGRGFRETPGRAVLIQEGVDDEVIPNFTTWALARAMGVPTVNESQPGPGPVRAHVRVDATRYGKAPGYNGHNVFWDLQPARTQVLSFLESAGARMVLE